MRIPQFDPQRDSGANMTPMIDVVFLLIIFFLVSSHLAQRENQLPLDLPTATSGKDSVESESRRLTLNVLPTGELLLAGSPIQPSDLRASFLAAKNRQGADLELRIRADRQAPYRFVAPVLTAAAGSGIWNVSFSVFRDTGS